MDERTATAVKEALNGKVEIGTECWTFTGQKTSKGYGRVRRSGKKLLAHRYVYEATIGPIPDRATVGHTCSTNDCVNPSHLTLNVDAILEPVEACQQCGSSIPESAPPGSRYCGTECRKAAKVKRNNERKNAPKKQLSTVCVICGSVIPRVHPRGALPKYCSNRCRNAADRERKGKPRFTLEVFTVACAVCSVSFTTPHPNAKYCGQDCKKEANRRKAREKYAADAADDGAREARRQRSRDRYRKQRAAVGGGACNVCGEPLGLHRKKTCGKAECIHQLQLERGRRYAESARHGEARPPRFFIAGTCSECGGAYVHERSNMSGAHLLTYCSDRCRDRAGRRRYKRRYGKFAVSDAQRLAIYERDNWTCQICHQQVERNGDPLGPLAPTLDHIEPQSMTLIPDHSEYNLRTACRRCNTSRKATVTKAELSAVKAKRKALLAA